MSGLPKRAPDDQSRGGGIRRPLGVIGVCFFFLSISLSPLSTLFPSLKLPPGGPRKLQTGGGGGVVRAQRASHKPYDAPNFAQQRLRANPQSWLPYKTLPDPPWKHFANRKVRSDRQTCCKIPIRICFFCFKKCATCTKPSAAKAMCQSA